MHEPGMVLELTRNCDIGRMGERAVVVYVGESTITVVFPMRPGGERVLRTNRDYKFFKEV